MRIRRLLALFLLIAALPVLARPARTALHHPKVIQARFMPTSNLKKRAAMKPNVDIYVYRRSYTPGEKVQMRLSGFNVPPSSSPPTGWTWGRSCRAARHS